MAYANVNFMGMSTLKALSGADRQRFPVGLRKVLDCAFCEDEYSKRFTQEESAGDRSSLFSWFNTLFRYRIDANGRMMLVFM